MSTSPRSLTVGAIALVALTSCSLPPREAWRQIQRDGLIPFVATQWSEDTAPAAVQSNRKMIAQTQKKQTPAPAVVASTNGNVIGPPVVSQNNTPSPAMIDAKSIPLAQAVPGLAGYVRTPYTSPPRLVDVRGMSAGSKVVCPFTNKPFLVPSAATSEPKVAAAPTPAPLPEAPKVVAPTLSPTVQAAPTTVAAMNKPQPTAPPATAPTPQVKPQVKPQTPGNPPASNKSAAIASTPAAKAETQEIPFGNPISGRPGFVNSPYAAKHQLVDVAGLPVGMEVKCPYTGKLFRVPPQDQAQGKVPAQNAASPEKK